MIYEKCKGKHACVSPFKFFFSLSLLFSRLYVCGQSCKETPGSLTPISGFHSALIFIFPPLQVKTYD